MSKILGTYEIYPTFSGGFTPKSIAYDSCKTKYTVRAFSLSQALAVCYKQVWVEEGKQVGIEEIYDGRSGKSRTYDNRQPHF